MAKLTAKAVEAIKPATARTEIPDSLLPGLYLVVQPSGARSWAVRYRHHGTPRKFTLGGYPALDLKAARELGAKALRAAAEGRDPAQEKRAAQMRLGDVQSNLLDFQKNHLRKKNGESIRETTRTERARLLGLKPDPEKPGEWIATGNGILQRWGDRDLAGITKDDVRAAINATAKSGPILANRTLSALKTFFNWCVKDDRLAKSPAEEIDLPSPETASDRVLSDNEIKRIWQAAEQMGPPYGALVQLLILTGQRRGEIAGLMWREIDLEKDLISLPRERVKNNKSHEIPLSPRATAIIERLPRISERYVFSTNGSTPISGFGKFKERLDALCGFSDWVIHDIRRSVASGLARLGTALPVTEKVLNHVSGSFAGVAGIYQRHDFAAEKKSALEAWSAHIERLISGKTADKIVSIRGQRR
jgi:integrase